MSNVNVEGTWALTVQSPMGPMASSLTFETVDGVLKGEQTAQGTTTECEDIAVSDDGTVTWVNAVTKPMKMKLTFNGKIDGDSIEGKVKAGMMGGFNFTGTRS